MYRALSAGLKINLVEIISRAKSIFTSKVVFMVIWQKNEYLLVRLCLSYLFYMISAYE